LGNNKAPVQGNPGSYYKQRKLGNNKNLSNPRGLLVSSLALVIPNLYEPFIIYVTESQDMTLKVMFYCFIQT
jgi:hypothetical protein